jgi:hypothetical protein
MINFHHVNDINQVVQLHVNATYAMCVQHIINFHYIINFY